MDISNLEVHDWKNSNIQIFWGEIAPCDHLIQIYESNSVFLETLVGFAGSGLLSDESVIVIATEPHLEELKIRLMDRGFNIKQFEDADQFIPVNALEALGEFMVNNWPDENLFNNYVNKLLSRAGKNKRKVRAFGEMVALLWENGHNGATVCLENLWHNIHKDQSFTLYCAYPKIGFTQCAADSLDTICKTHHKIIKGNYRANTEIYYRSV
jgi:KaiC/GvpD/RAD55 family RecA-like ATPase